MATWRTIAVIAAREVRAAVRQRSVYLLGGLVGTLLLVAATLGAWRSLQLAEERATYQTLVQRQWEAQPDRHPHRAAHFGSFAFRPMGGLAAFDFGVDGFVGTTVYQEAHRQNTANFSEAGHASSMLRFGQLSMAMVLQVILPLLIVFRGFAAIAAERENGILTLARAQGVSLGTLIIGKQLGLLATVALVLAPAGLVGGLVIALAGGHALGADTLGRAGLLILTYGAYLLLWTGLVVSISARARTARGALAAGLALWVITVVVVPRAAAALAGSLHPSPARIEFDEALAAEIQESGDSHNPKDPKFAALERDTLARYGVEKVEQLPINFGGLVMKVGEEIGSRIYTRHFDRLVAIHERQDRVMLGAALLSPLLAVRTASMALAGTGPADHQAFLRQAEQYRYELIQRLNELHIHEIRYQDDRAQRVSQRHWKETPAFDARPVPLSEVVPRQLPAAACLAIWLAVVAAVAAAIAARGRRLA